MGRARPVYMGEPRSKRFTVERGIRWRWAPNPTGQMVQVYEVMRPHPTKPGKQQWRTVGAVGITDARKERVQFLAGDERAPRNERPQIVTVAMVAEEFLKKKTREGLAQGTLDDYRRAVDQHIAKTWPDEPIERVTPDDVAEWVDAQRDTGAAGSTIVSRWKVLNGMYKLAIRRGYVTTNPLDALDRGERPAAREKEVRILTEEELGGIIDAAAPKVAAVRQAPLSSGWQQLLVSVAIFTGMRLGEVNGLQWADIDYSDEVVHVRRQVDRYGKLKDMPKTSAGFRRVILMDELATALKERYLASPFKAPGDPVFASRVGTPLDRKKLRTAWNDARGAAKIPSSVTLHAARHTFASILIAQGRDIVFVSKQLGHSDINVTLSRYSHLFNEAAHAEAAREGLSAAYGHLIPGGLRAV